MTANTFYYYIYEKNLQGDIVAIYNTSGVRLVSYTYDAWGNVSVSNINISGTNAGAQYNPFRYRGYYYDEEIGLYYLNSRYYDPATGRFINSDGVLISSLLGYNLFAYCENNPVIRVDNNGAMWNLIPSLHPRNRALKTVGGSSSVSAGNMPSKFTPSYYESNAYDTYVKSSMVAMSDGALGGYYTDPVTDAMLNPGHYSVPSAVSVTDGMAYRQKTVSGKTYYHVTTPKNASSIISDQQLKGRTWEGGYVYAWRKNPSSYAIKNSGAHFGVTISFRTNATFVRDTGIDNPSVNKYLPVVSSSPGPIEIWDINIVG